MKKVLLINMPFASLMRPAIGISLLKARLAEDSKACSIGYASLLFAERVGSEAYGLIADRVSAAMFAGDWLFSQWLFPGRDSDTFLATLRRELKGSDTEMGLYQRMQDDVAPFLEECLSRFDVAGHDLIGFTSTFEQNLASLALAKLIKDRYPEKTIAFGGANCEGPMGLELHRRFPWIDFVFSGESDFSFPELVKRLELDQPLAGIRGLIYREGGDSKLAAPQDRIDCMDRLPDPDYTDYFAQVEASPIRDHIRPALLIETARGCWWGAKSHCTFCGLNGSTLAFRSKSADRVFDELTRQKARYGTGRFLAVDNIMPNNYFRDLLPRLRDEDAGVSLFYEIKSNLRRDQIELLRDAGVRALQPGIESLSTHVLKLMRKGVTAINNVQLLRFCHEYGIEIAWNLLYGFPGETEDDYLQTAETIRSIMHLKPPGMAAPIRLDRFSPNFDQAEEFGFSAVRPFSMYAYVYPLPPESLAQIAYFFEYDYANGQDPNSYIGPVLELVAEWRSRPAAQLTLDRQGECLRLIDSRDGQGREYRLEGQQRAVYELCDEIQSLATLEERAGGEWLQPFLDSMVDRRLLFREGQQYVALAVDSSRRQAARKVPEVALF